MLFNKRHAHRRVKLTLPFPCIKRGKCGHQYVYMKRSYTSAIRTEHPAACCFNKGGTISTVHLVMKSKAWTEHLFRFWMLVHTFNDFTTLCRRMKAVYQAHRQTDKQTAKNTQQLAWTSRNANIWFIAAVHSNSQGGYSNSGCNTKQGLYIFITTPNDHSYCLFSFKWSDQRSS